MHHVYAWCSLKAEENIGSTGTIGPDDCGLGTNPRSSTRVASTLNHWTIFWACKFLILLSPQLPYRCLKLVLCLKKANAKSEKSSSVLFIGIKNRSLEWIPALKGLSSSYCNIISNALSATLSIFILLWGEEIKIPFGVIKTHSRSITKYWFMITTLL